MTTINDIVAASHNFVAQYVKPGSTCVDATAGNGNDTLFLAKLVGKQGCVHSVDVQQIALDKTKALLEQYNMDGRVRLHLADHKDIPRLVERAVQALMFNLGYLPGGDKAVTTYAANSIIALGNCLGILAPGGIISVVTYSGHPGGEEEESQVAAWCGGLNPREFSVSCYSMVNKPNRPPKLWLVHRTVK